jgi:hypothetical protein
MPLFGFFVFTQARKPPVWAGAVVAASTVTRPTANSAAIPAAAIFLGDVVIVPSPRKNIVGFIPPTQYAECVNCDTRARRRVPPRSAVRGALIGPVVDMPGVATFCLIHGAWHDASCWDPLA